jgi:recombinational DNA repair ATPase RecF
VEESGGSVAQIITEALKADKVPHQVASLVVGAMPVTSEKAASPMAGPKRTYLKAITVEGFRGIGPKITLTLQPGPGLTVVTGRNGSGKSSFAEAAELALTGENKRWSDQTAVWKEGWRNLHAPDTSAITVQLTEDGEPGTTTVAREWAARAALDDAQVRVQTAGIPQPLAAKGWTKPLELYRPFLSYSELGALVSGQPSKMHDALQAILGLDVLTDTERALNDARRSAESESKLAKQGLPALRAKLAEHPDERARAAENALAGRAWDLAGLDALTADGEAAADRGTGLLQKVVSLTLPALDDVVTAVARVAEARSAVASLAGTRADEARRLAALLSAALAHQRSHAGEPCPVCGGRVLDDAWVTATEASIADLTSQAASAEAAHGEEAAAVRALGEVVPPKPMVLRADFGGEIDASAAAGAWDRWTPPDVSAETFAALSTAVDELRSQAAAVLRRRAEAWQPVAYDLAAWVRQARKSEAAAARLADLRKAIDWLRKIGAQVRNARLAPFAQASAQVWETLRQESNVELGPITLAGAGTQRRVALDVTVDGAPSAALSVMSQGELHALGLALFLPRATAADSPFGFVVIDDPVQSMDPAKVDGLARVLSSAAASRQVVVFTHDDRLPAALRQLQLPATVWAVTRRERSVVSLKKVNDPVSRYLDDARALARTEQLPATVRAVAVAGMCRGALEAACVEVVRSRELAAGVPHESVERQLESAANSVQDIMALALFGSASRAGEVVKRVRELGGEACVRAFWDAKQGVHDPMQGDLRRFVENTERLTKALRQ